MIELHVGDVFRTGFGIYRYKVVARAPNGTIFTKCPDTPSSHAVTTWTPDKLAKYQIVVEERPTCEPS